MLRNGNKGAHGGPRKNSGRPPDWLKQKCQEAVDRSKLIELINRIACGEETESHITKDGDVVQVAMSGMVRLRAAEMLLDRGFGKPIQALEHTGNVATSYKIVFETTND